MKAHNNMWVYPLAKVYGPKGDLLPKMHARVLGILVHRSNIPMSCLLATEGMNFLAIK